MAPSSTTTTRARSRRARLDRRTIAVCVAVAAVAAALSAVLVAGAVGDGGEATAGLERSRPAPTLSFGRFDGSTGSVADYRGQKLVVNFFSSTCVPCKREMPALEQVQREAGDEITVLGIDVQDTPEAGRAMVRQTGVTYDIGRDPNGTLFNRFGATLLPATAFVDTDGTLLDLHTGALTARQLRAKISATLLGGG